MCVVVWYRNNKKHETLIPTPETNKGLVSAMFGHKVGASEIRAVKSVDPSEMLGNFARQH